MSTYYSPNPKCWKTKFIQPVQTDATVHQVHLGGSVVSRCVCVLSVKTLSFHVVMLPVSGNYMHNQSLTMPAKHFDLKLFSTLSHAEISSNPLLIKILKLEQKCLAASESKLPSWPTLIRHLQQTTQSKSCVLYLSYKWCQHFLALIRFIFPVHLHLVKHDFKTSLGYEFDSF